MMKEVKQEVEGFLIPDLAGVVASYTSRWPAENMCRSLSGASSVKLRPGGTDAIICASNQHKVHLLDNRFEDRVVAAKGLDWCADVAFLPDYTMVLTDTTHHRLLFYPKTIPERGEVKPTSTLKNSAFDSCCGIHATADGIVFTTDWNKKRIHKVDPTTGRIVHSFAGDEKTGTFKSPFGIAEGPHKELYVTDRGNERIVVLDKDFRFIESLVPKPKLAWGQYLALNSRGEIFTCDYNGTGVLHLNPDGSLIHKLPHAITNKDVDRGTGVTLLPDESLLVCASYGSVMLYTREYIERGGPQP